MEAQKYFSVVTGHNNEWKGAYREEIHKEKICHTEPNKLGRETPTNKNYHSLSEVIFSFKKKNIRNLLLFLNFYFLCVICYIQLIKTSEDWRPE